MAKIWKYVLIAVLALLAFGVLLAGAGLLTGASPERTWNGLQLADRLNTALETLNWLPFQL